MSASNNALLCKVGCGCNTCFGLIRCDDPEVILYTRTNLQAYVGHTVSLIGHEGFTYGVFVEHDCNVDRTYTDVTIDEDISSTFCYCFKLTNCFDSEDVVYSRTSRLATYLSFLISIGDDTDPNGPYRVEIATEEECTDPIEVIIIDVVHGDCDVDCNLWLALFGSCINVDLPQGWHAFLTDEDDPNSYEPGGTIIKSCVTVDCGYEFTAWLPCGTSDKLFGDPPPPLDISTDPCIQFSSGGPFTLTGNGCGYFYADFLGCVIAMDTAPRYYPFCSGPNGFHNPNGGPDTIVEVNGVRRSISLTLVENPLNNKWHWHAVVTIFSFTQANCGFNSGPFSDCCEGFTFRIQRQSIFNSPEYTPTEIYDAWNAAAVGATVWTVPRDMTLDPDIDETFHDFFPCYGNFDEGIPIIKHERCGPKPSGCYRHLLADCSCSTLIEVDYDAPIGPVVNVEGRCFQVQSISFIPSTEPDCQDAAGSGFFDSCEDCNAPTITCSDCCDGGPTDFFFLYLIIRLGVVAAVPGHPGLSTFLNTNFFNRIYNLPPTTDCASDTFITATAFFDDGANDGTYTGFWHTETKWQLTKNFGTGKCQFEIFADLYFEGSLITGIYLSDDLTPPIDCTGFTAPSPMTLTRASGDNIGSLDSVIIVPRGYNCEDGI